MTKKIFIMGKNSFKRKKKQLHVGAWLLSLITNCFWKLAMADPWGFFRMVKTWQHGADGRRRGRDRVVVIPLGNDVEEAESLNEDSKSNMNTQIEGEICTMKESPYRIFKVAENGNLKEFERLYLGDPSRLKAKDLKGRNVLHAAASKNRVNILQYALERGADINDLDSVGDTALHVAVRHEALEALDFLINNGADLHIHNLRKQAPIHLATVLNKVTVVKQLVKHKEKFDVMIGGEHGRTALHLAAIYDLPECAEVLLSDMKCCPRRTCNNGFYPIHEAAKNASAKCLEVILRWGESIGCDRYNLMHFKDLEGNDPLHSAVNGGDVKAVKICLENGARISTQQNNLATPVHLACSQGSLEIVKLMFTLQPEEKREALAIGDVQKMTPLHCAAMFDHVDIVDYLIAEGAKVDPIDKEHRTPLLLASSRGGWKTVRTLLNVGADTATRDVNNRNVFHFIVLQGGSLEEFALLMQQFHIPVAERLNEKDGTGCTPMHLASRNGYFRSIDSLIKLGATINMKDNDHQSPLHFAARYGRYNTVRKLLQSDKGPFIINESNGEGQTALHIASLNGHTRVVQLLLARGALLHRDHDGRTPFHLAAKNGYIETMDMLVCIHSHLLDQVDKDGNTALHLACIANKAGSVTYILNLGGKILLNKVGQTPLDIGILSKYQESALALATHDERSEEVLHTCSRVFTNLPQALIAQMPDVFMAVLDKSITRSTEKRESKNYYIKYSFKHLQLTQQCIAELKSFDKKFKAPPLPALNTMVQHGRVELLTHPITQQYLQMKWDSYGMYFHVANLFVYIIFLFFLTLYTCSLVDLHKNDSVDAFLTKKFRKKPMCLINAFIIAIFVMMNFLKEFFQFYQQRFKYLTDPINLLEWILYVSSAVMIWPIYFNNLWDSQITSASIASFLAWFNFLLYLQRFNRVGIYVVMFLEILKTLVKVLMLFSILIIAFGLALYILMCKADQLAFYNAPLSLIRVFSMMLGEIDFLGSYVAPLFSNQTSSLGKHTNNPGSSTLPFPEINLGFLVIFMVFMPILLMNLLIGLAVGDIESVRRNAQLKRIAMQVELHTELERKLPQFLLKKVDKDAIVIYPNNACQSCTPLWNFIYKYLGVGMSKPQQTLLQLDNYQEEDIYFDELIKHKQRLKEMGKTLDSQQQLLRLIVQKMEIKTEADDFDEGIDSKKIILAKTFSNTWKSPKFNQKLKSSVAFASHFKKSDS